MVGLWGASSLVKSVQRGSIALGAAASATATVTAVDLANSVVTYGGASCSGSVSTAAITNTRVALTNATTVTGTRQTADAVTTSVTYEVVEWMPGVVKSVQSGTVIHGTPATITSVNTAKTVVFFGGNSVANATQANLNVTVTLTNATTVTAVNDGGNTHATASFMVVEFF